MPFDYAAANHIEIQNCESSAHLVDLCQPHIKDMNLQDICAVLHVLKKFPEEPQMEFMNQLCNQIIHQKTGLMSSQIARIFHACARLGYKNGELFQVLANRSILPFQVRRPISHQLVAASL